MRSSTQRVPPSLLSSQHFQLGLADPGPRIALPLVEVDDALAASSSNAVSFHVPPPFRKPSVKMLPFGLFSFSFFLSVPSLTAVLPMKSIRLILSFGPSATMKVTLTSLGPPATSVSVCEIREFANPFSVIRSSSTVSTRRIVARSTKASSRTVNVLFAKLVVDVAALDDLDRLALAVAVVDDLHALALFADVADDDPDRSVRERVVGALDPQVVEERRVAHQRLEVGLGDFSRRVVPRAPDALRRPADEARRA